MAGKGSARRPMQISREEFDIRYELSHNPNLTDEERERLIAKLKSLHNKKKRK